MCSEHNVEVTGITIEEPYSNIDSAKINENFDYVTMFGVDKEAQSWFVDWLNEGLAMSVNGRCTFLIYCKWRQGSQLLSYKDYLINHSKRKEKDNGEDSEES